MKGDRLLASPGCREDERTGRCGENESCWPRTGMSPRRPAIPTEHPSQTSLHFSEWRELLDPCPLLSLPLQLMGVGGEELSRKLGDW